MRERQGPEWGICTTSFQICQRSRAGWIPERPEVLPGSKGCGPGAAASKNRLRVSLSPRCPKEDIHPKLFHLRAKPSGQPRLPPCDAARRLVHSPTPASLSLPHSSCHPERRSPAPARPRGIGTSPTRSYAKDRKARARLPGSRAFVPSPIRRPLRGSYPRRHGGGCEVQGGCATGEGPAASRGGRGPAGMAAPAGSAGGRQGSATRNGSQRWNPPPVASGLAPMSSHRKIRKAQEEVRGRRGHSSRQPSVVRSAEAAPGS
jgi:hypothetical protein